MGVRILELFLLYILINGAYCEEYLCSGTCDPTQRTVFKVGHTYVFRYAVDALTRANVSENGDLNHNVGFSLTSDVEIYVLSPCDLIMKIENAELQDVSNTSEKVDGDETLNNTITNNYLHIHYKNGSIPEVCFAESDPTWVLNMKRGIVSLLQYSWEDTNHTAYETDVNGNCEHQYTTGEADGWRIVKKKTNLGRCTGRGGPYVYPGRDPTRTNTDKSAVRDQVYFGLDLLKSTRYCKYVLGDTLQPVTVTCKERHRLQPFYAARNMFVTNITQHLSLDRVIIKEMPVFKEYELKKQSLFMEFTEDKLFTIRNIVEAQETLERGDLTDDQRIMMLYSMNFITLLRNASYSELMTIYDRCHETNKWVLVNALALLKTAASMRAVLELYSRAEVEPYRMGAWLDTLPFIRETTAEMLLSIKPALMLQDCKISALLGVSGLVHSYCEGRADCSQEPEVQDLMKVWEVPLAAYPKDVDVYGILMALKATGNAGVTNHLKAIMDIIRDKKLPAFLRIAAMDSLRNNPRAIELTCVDISALLLEIADDPEVRISAYLNGLKCHSSDLLEKILFILQYEENNEVTSFIWSHLLRSQSLPASWKSNTTALLRDEFFRWKYQLAIGNSATYYEMNQTFPTLETAVTVDRRIINKSRFPWSSRTHLGISTFTNRTSVLEFEAHGRDLDSLLRAVFRTEERNRDDERSEHPHDNNIISDYDESDRKRKQMQELEGEILVRILGNDIYAFNFSTLLGSLFRNVDVSKKLGGSLESSKNIIFRLNSGYTLPTSIGCPLLFSLKTGGTVGLKWFSNADFKDAAVSKFDLEFISTPSLKVNVFGVMSLDAHVFRKGLKLSLNALLESKIKGSVSFEGGKRADFNLDVLKNQNTIEVTSKVEA